MCVFICSARPFQATVTQLNAGQLGGIALGLEAQALELGLQSDASTEAFFVAGGTNSATAEGMTLETLDAMGSLVDYTFQPSSTSEINVVTDPIVGTCEPPDSERCRFVGYDDEGRCVFSCGFRN